MIKNFLLQNKLSFQNFVKNFAKNFAKALLFGLAALGFSVLLSNLLYHPKKMVKRGFEVEIKLDKANVGEVKTANLKDLKPVSKSIASVDIAEMIKNADISAGEKVFKKCSTCHTIEKGGANKIGPNLYGIIGRKKASITSFSYSEAMKNKGGSWTIEELNQWITNPKNFAPGTKMGFAGLKKDKDRANVIAYLKQRTGN